MPRLGLRQLLLTTQPSLLSIGVCPQVDVSMPGLLERTHCDKCDAPLRDGSPIPSSLSQAVRPG